jgi:hypothetical protein
MCWTSGSRPTTATTQVRGDDDGVYILRHDSAADRGELTMFQRGGAG